MRSLVVLAMLLVACGSATPAPERPPAPAAPEPPPAPSPVASASVTPPAEPPPAPAPAPAASPNEAECQAKGGKVRPVCRMQRPACVLAFKDAGKACTDKKDCQGDCLGEGEKAKAGKCAPDNDPCGCKTKIVGGKATPTMCVD